MACNRSGQMVRSGKATNIHKFTTRRLGLRRPRNIPALNSETFDSRPQTKKCYNIVTWKMVQTKCSIHIYGNYSQWASIALNPAGLSKREGIEMVTSVGFFTYSCKVLLARPPVRCLTRGCPSKHSVSSRVPTIMNQTFLFFSFAIHQSCIAAGNMTTVMNLLPRHAFLFFSFVVHQSCIALGNMTTIMNIWPGHIFVLFSFVIPQGFYCVSLELHSKL